MGAELERRCFREEGGLDVVWGLRFVFVSVIVLETIVNQNCIRQAGFNVHFQTEMSLLDTQGQANTDSLFVLLLILPLPNEGILLTGARVGLG